MHHYRCGQYLIDRTRATRIANSVKIYQSHCKMLTISEEDRTIFAAAELVQQLTKNKALGCEEKNCQQTHYQSCSSSTSKGASAIYNERHHCPTDGAPNQTNPSLDNSKQHSNADHHRITHCTTQTACPKHLVWKGANNQGVQRANSKISHWFSKGQLTKSSPQSGIHWARQRSASLKGAHDCTARSKGADMHPWLCNISYAHSKAYSTPQSKSYPFCWPISTPTIHPHATQFVQPRQLCNVSETRFLVWIYFKCDGGSKDIHSKEY